MAQAPEPARMANRLFRAGASSLEIAPQILPVVVNGGFLPARATKVNDPIRAKCLVLDDGASRLAIVVVDSCMMPRELLDRAKVLAREKTGIPIDRMLISATHTHSAPAAMGALGTPADANYVAILPSRIAESIERAVRQLEPARIGWGSIDDPEHTFCRRWIRRPDRMIDDPFGRRTVRANMHPGYQNPDAIAPSGPVDPALTVLSVQSRTGRPIAVLANYSMHYYGAEPVSADYYGRFADALAKRIGTTATQSAGGHGPDAPATEGGRGADRSNPPFVAIMSQGTSGDQMWMDYGQPRKDPGLVAYADSVARVAHQAYRAITYRDWVPLAMAETTLALDRRAPDEARLAWARAVIARMGDREIPRNLSEVYAKEAIFLHETPRRELRLQAIRVGDLGVTAIPNEVFAITGLKLKSRSPFELTMNIELANGSEGYIPPPEQHTLGGYTTWPARTAGLEVQAEPKIVATLLGLLEQVAGRPRRSLRVASGPYTEAVLASRPLAYWRLDEIEGSIALDATGHGRHAAYQGGVAFFLPGPDAPGLSIGKSSGRAAHFAGGHIRAEFDRIGDANSLELWFWNGLPNNARPIIGSLLAIGVEGEDRPSGDHLGIGGTEVAPGRLYFASGRLGAPVLAGKFQIVPKTWHHLVLVRDGNRVAAYLDGNPEPEITGEAERDPVKGRGSLLIGGRGEGVTSFEGKIDEVAFYDRALDAAEIAGHLRAARAR
jgi:hypothetical protein